MASNVKSYTDTELLNRVRTHANNFSQFPSEYWLLFVRSEENAPNKFDDKIYLYRGTEFIKVWTGTTNAGKSGLRYPVNPKGCAVLKSDEFYLNGWRYDWHRGKVLAYKQTKNLPVYRDNDRDDYAEEIGVLDVGNFGINIHPASYVKGSTAIRENIDGWSVGCLVFQTRSDFDEFMRITNKQPLLSAALLKEF